MKRTITLLTAIMATATTIYARQLTPAESLERFAAGQPALHKAQSIAKEQLTLGYTSTISADKNAFYVFEYPQSAGFIILGADDLAPEVLGYSETGSFDADNLPEGLAYWTQELNRQIALAVKAGVPLYSSTASKVQRATVAPLVSSKWGQGDENSPYYNDCPKYKGEQLVTGCVATAMAQVMYYHKHPKRGQGSNSYTTETHHISQSANFNTAYDWNSMLDAYGYTYKDNGEQGYDFNYYNTTQGAAVAKLMHHCGVSVNMDYDTASSGGSGASSSSVMPALYKYFNYDAGGRFCLRDCFTDAAWEDLVYNELANDRPLFYGGSTSTSGHAFVIDGYLNGYYHINWGWDNLGNGYYAMTGTDPLHPTRQGTGGSIVNEGFKYKQACITGIRPAVNGSRLVPNFYLFGESFDVTDTETNPVSHLDKDGWYVVFASEGIFGYSNDAMEVYFNAKFVNCETQAVFYAQPNEESFRLDTNYGILGLYFNTQGIPDGQYNVYPVVRAEGATEWTDIAIPVGTQAPQVIVGNYTPTTVESDAELACSAITLDKANTQNRTVSVEVANVLNVSTDNSAFWGDLAIGIYDKSGTLEEVLTDGKCSISQEYSLSHYKYYTNPFTLKGTVPTTLKDGDYELSPVAFQQNSTNWTRLGIFDVDKLTYDMEHYHSIEMTVRNGRIYFDNSAPEPEEPYGLYVSDDVTISGSSLILPVSLRNAAPICGLQFDVTLPSGVSFHKTNNKEDVKLSTQRTTTTKTDVFDFEKQSNSTMRVVACSTAGTAFSSNNGEVANIQLTVTSTRQKGFTVKLTNIVLTDSDAKAYKLPDYEKEIKPTTVGIDNVSTDAHPTTEVYMLNGVRSSRNTHSGVTIIKNGNVVRKELK